MTDSKKLNEVIKASGFKREFLAEKCGISRQTLSYKINNKQSFNADEIAILCNVLNITDLAEKESIFFAQWVE